MMHVTLHQATLSLGSGPPHEVVPWNDPLFFGPVPAGMEFLELRKYRETWLTEQSRRQYGPVDPEMEAKFRKLAAARPPRPTIENRFEALLAADEIVLWFGPGMGQQLALLQSVDLFSANPARLSVIGVNPIQFRPEDSEAVLEHFNARHLLSPNERIALQKLWAAFRDPFPVEFHRKAEALGSTFPNCRTAAGSIRELFPSSTDGLSGMERRILKTLAAEPEITVVLVAELLSFAEFFDGWLFGVIVDMLNSPVPLISTSADGHPYTQQLITQEELHITEAGRAVLARQADAVELNGIDNWVGGCHLESDRRSVFRWNEDRRAFVSPDGSLQPI